jgi:hypothetical protein
MISPIDKLQEGQSPTFLTPEVHKFYITLSPTTELHGGIHFNKDTLQHKLRVSSWTEPDYSSEDQTKPTLAHIALYANLTISGVYKG